jgi:hypothetical protein
MSTKNYLYSHFMDMDKYSQYLYYIDTFGLPEGEKCKSGARAITIQREQYGGTIHLFIDTGRSPDKVTSMSLLTNYNHNANC